MSAFERRQLGAIRIAVTRLLHYAPVSVGFVIALLVLGIDLTKITLLVSALGVGVGFGVGAGFWPTPAHSTTTRLPATTRTGRS